MSDNGEIRRFDSAAMSLGANRLRTFLNVVLPLSLPGIAGGFILGALVRPSGLIEVIVWFALAGAVSGRAIPRRRPSAAPQRVQRRTSACR